MKLSRSDKHFYKELQSRSIQLAKLANKGERAPEFVALEILTSLFSGYQGGLQHRDVIDALGVREWREQTVPVPYDLLRLIVESWFSYRNQDNNKTFGECLGIEGGGQGRQRAANKQDVRDRNQSLANRVTITLLMAKNNSVKMSQAQAFSLIRDEEIELGRQTSVEAIRLAWRKQGKPTFDQLK